MADSGWVLNKGLLPNCVIEQAQSSEARGENIRGTPQPSRDLKLHSPVITQLTIKC